MVASVFRNGTSRTPGSRISRLNDAEQRPEGQFVLYWMTSARRTSWNYGLQRAVEVANDRHLPLLIFEAIRHDYEWANDRHHAFILDGMLDNARALAASPATYAVFVGSESDNGAGLLSEIAERACLVVTDHFPCFFLPRMVESFAKKVKVSVESVDSNGILPLSVSEREYTTAHSFRRFAQKNLHQHLEEWPERAPIESLKNRQRVDLSAYERLPTDPIRYLSDYRQNLSSLPIDHTVSVGCLAGGASEGALRLGTFLEFLVDEYHENRNAVDESGTSLLSPYLHYGHISAHEVVYEVLIREGWEPSNIPAKASGSRSGWWGLSEGAEAFLDQIITWRELGFHFCHHRPIDYDKYESLPAWALKTLEEHRRDQRPVTYTQTQLERAETDDPIWNAAQRQLVQTGLMHNYLRMLWGKKVLQWSESPGEALVTLIQLNNKYALDGRDPNSYSGIFWVFGRFDRAWGPERSIFGKTRYMTSQSTQKKLKLTNYLEKYAS